MSEENLNEELDEQLEEATVDTEAEVETEVESEAEVAEEAAEEVSGDGELEKRYMSLFAEYENFRKRTAKEKEDLYASAIASVTKDWLSVLDNIDRAIDSSRNADESSIEKVIQGIELVGKQANDVLAKLGVEEIEAARGVAFDPNLHEAVMAVDDPELNSNEIAAVFQKGYIYKDRVVRHAVVQVAN